MNIHILNCASMAPWFPRWQVGTPCIVIETHQGLVLVDTGLGLHDYTSPSRIVRFFRWIFRIPDNPETTAVRQLARINYSPESVKHLVMTHLHFDHAGGLPDFPHAQVHVHRFEVEAMLHPRSWTELAYDPQDFSHSPSWVLYEHATHRWFGLDAIGLPFTPEIYLVPLFGHSRGHCGVAIQDGDTWVFQCGDSLPISAKFDYTPAWLNRLVLGPHGPKLQRWASEHPHVRLLAGHMWQPFFEHKP